jgi:hypothetical protein
MKTLLSFLEGIWMIIYFTIAVIVCVILFPFWFLFGKPHYEESGYDN